MKRHARAIAAALSLTFLVTSTPAIQAQFVIPVSRVLHAQAAAGDSGGSTVDNPPDLVIGSDPGSFSHSALALSPQGFGRGSASTSSTITPNGSPGIRSVLDISASASGTILGGFPPVSGSGQSSQTVVLDVPTDQAFGLDVFAFGGGGGFTIMSLKVQNDDGLVILNQSYSPNTNFNNHPVFLPADRYTFTASASDFIHIAGSSGGGFIATFKVVPEPTAIAFVAFGATSMFRPRRRSPMIPSA